MNNIETDLEWTGERYLPHITGNIALEHLHRYAYACEYITDKVVLDIASGEGYGSAMLSKKASHVYGVDIDLASIGHAKNKYKSSKLDFLQGSCTEIPIQDASVDIVVSFETIEHIIDHDRMMIEIKRVLRPDGILIISSPDRKEYSEATNQINPFHLKELNFEEFSNLLKIHFNQTAFLGQKIVYGSALIEMADQGEICKTYQYDELPGKIIPIRGLNRPVYIIGVCSNRTFSCASGGLCEQNIHESEVVSEYKTLVTTRDTEISSLKNNLAAIKKSSDSGQKRTPVFLNKIYSAINSLIKLSKKFTTFYFNK